MLDYLFFQFSASGDYIVPTGATVVIAQYKVHRLKEHYPNPDVFDPDNFLPERTQDRHYYAYIPFSAGPRFVTEIFVFN